MTQLELLSAPACQRAGWSQTQPNLPRTSALYEHDSGWIIVHCGHPTALRPYYAISPAGDEVFDDDGGGWRTVKAAKLALYKRHNITP